jgi:hypothetical protein
MPTAPNNDGYEVMNRQEGKIYQKIILEDNLIMGMIFVGDIEKSGVIFSLMRDKVNVESFKQWLLTDDFGLAFLPRALWQERLETSPELFFQSVRSTQTERETFIGE